MKKVTVLALTILSLLAVPIQADEVSDLKAKVEAQEKELSQLKDQVNQLDSRQRLKEKAVQEDLAAVKEQAAKTPELPSWLEKISWYGDFRYRHEQINDKGDSSDPRYNRNRIRARIGMKAKINDEIEFNLRLGTGNSDPASTNQTLGEAWSSKPVWIDHAYIAYKPKAVKGWGIGLGKGEAPYYKQNSNQLIWDDDLNPEGIYTEYNGNLSSSTKFTGALGGFWVVERHSSSDSSDSGLLGAQFLIDQAIRNSSLSAGVGYFVFTDLMGNQALYSEWNTGTPTFFGNDNTGGGSPKYRMDYSILELFLGWASQVGSLPYSIFGSGVLNTEATTNSVTGDKEDTGYMAGATLGKAKNQWDWSLAYDYRHVKADAVIGQFNDSDFLGGNTGGKGHRVSGALQVHENTTLVTTLFLDNQYDASHGSKAGKNFNRLQVDLKVKVK